jgi:hypothetical protein
MQLCWNDQQEKIKVIEEKRHQYCTLPHIPHELPWDQKPAPNALSYSMNLNYVTFGVLL